MGVLNAPQTSMEDSEEGLCIDLGLVSAMCEPVGNLWHQRPKALIILTVPWVGRWIFVRRMCGRFPVGMILCTAYGAMISTPNPVRCLP